MKKIKYFIIILASFYVFGCKTESEVNDTPIEEISSQTPKPRLYPVDFGFKSAKLKSPIPSYIVNASGIGGDVRRIEVGDDPYVLWTPKKKEMEGVYVEYETLNNKIEKITLHVDIYASEMVFEQLDLMLGPPHGEEIEPSLGRSEWWPIKSGGKVFRQLRAGYCGPIAIHPDKVYGYQIVAVSQDHIDYWDKSRGDADARSRQEIENAFR
jgi:hypothetical protein